MQAGVPEFGLVGSQIVIPDMSGKGPGWRMGRNVGGVSLSMRPAASPRIENQGISPVIARLACTRPYP